MEIVTKEELLVKKEKFKRKILEGKVFIYPTDTIYGLGCDATNFNSVEKLRIIKAHAHRPFSVIAPSKKWVLENCELNKIEMNWLDKLPGPYTLILKFKKQLKNQPISSIVNLNLDTIGVRIPSNWIHSFLSELNIPIVTTAANLTGEDYMETIDDLPTRIKQSVNFVIYEGPIKGRPSMIIKSKEVKEQIIKR